MSTGLVGRVCFVFLSNGFLINLLDIYVSKDFSFLLLFVFIARSELDVVTFHAILIARLKSSQLVLKAFSCLAALVKLCMVPIVPLNLICVAQEGNIERLFHN